MSPTAKRSPLTIDDLPLGAPSVGACEHGLDWLTADQAERWADAAVFSGPLLFTLICKAHNEEVGRVGRDTLYLDRGDGVDVIPDVLAFEGLLARSKVSIPKAMLEEHAEARREVNTRAEALGVSQRRSRRQATLRWAKGFVYSALLNDPALPELLPMACPRCGGLEVSRRQLVRWSHGPAGAVYRVPSLSR